MRDKIADIACISRHIAICYGVARFYRTELCHLFASGYRDDFQQAMRECAWNTTTDCLDCDDADDVRLIRNAANRIIYHFLKSCGYRRGRKIKRYEHHYTLSRLQWDKIKKKEKVL